jgi:hypothetical protein
MQNYSKSQILPWARDFVAETKCPYTSSQVEQLANLAAAMWTTTVVMKVTEAHKIVFASTPYAGEYRTNVLMDIARGVERNYPRSTLVPQMMIRVFYPQYQRVMSNLLAPTTVPEEDIAWQIGALLRVIHPFVKGTMAISWVIENQIRIGYGLSVTTRLRPKVEFDQYRQAAFESRQDQVLRRL